MNGQFSRRDILLGAAACAAATGLGVNWALATEDAQPDHVQTQTLAFIKRCALGDSPVRHVDPGRASDRREAEFARCTDIELGTRNAAGEGLLIVGSSRRFSYKSAMPDQDLYSGLIRLHVLYHASAGVIFGLGMIRELQHHGYRVGPGTLYPMLHRMQEKGYLRSEQTLVEGKIRRIYRITTRGRGELTEATAKVRELYNEMVEGQGEPSPAHPDSGLSRRESRRKRLQRSPNGPLGGGEGFHPGKNRG